MKPNRDSLFPNDISDEATAVLREFLYSLAGECESRYFIQLRRYSAKQQTVFDPDHPWLSRPPDR